MTQLLAVLALSKLHFQLGVTQINVYCEQSRPRLKELVTSSQAI